MTRASSTSSRFGIIAVITGCAFGQAKTDTSSLSSETSTAAASPATSKTVSRDYRHSPELNRIMNLRVNKPFSQLTFYVFHSNGDYDFAEIARTVEKFLAGVKEVRAFRDPPVSSEQGREVFSTYLEGLEGDGHRLAAAVSKQDSSAMHKLVGKLSRTCNSCHHFFRLDITDAPEL